MVVSVGVSAEKRVEDEAAGLLVEAVDVDESEEKDDVDRRKSGVESAPCLVVVEWNAWARWTYTAIF